MTSKSGLLYLPRKWKKNGKNVKVVNAKYYGKVMQLMAGCYTYQNQPNKQTNKQINRNTNKLIFQ